jgi:hypothetical protein
MVISISNESKEVCKDMLKDEINNKFIEILMKELEEKLKNIMTTQIKKTCEGRGTTK